MRTRREWGAAIFSGGVRTTYRTQGGTSSRQASVERGTLTKDTWQDASGGLRAEILVDGNRPGEEGEYSVGVPMASGTRVSIIKRGSQSIVMPLSSAIVEQAKQVTMDAVDQETDRLQGLIDQAEADIADIKQTRPTSTEVQQMVDEEAGSIMQSVAQNYVPQAYADTTLATKSEVQQTSDSILQTVSEDYVNNQTLTNYSTKSELEQTSTDLTATFTTNLDNAIDGVESDVSTMIRLSTDGVEVGKADSTVKALVNAEGSFDVTNGGATMASFSASGDETSIDTSLDLITLKGVDEAKVTVGQGAVRLSASAGTYIGGSTTKTLGTASSAASWLNAVGATLLFANSAGTPYGGDVELKVAPKNFHTVEVVFFDTGGRVATARTVNNGGDVFVSASRLVFNGSCYASTFALSCAANSTTCSWALPGTGAITSMGNTCDLKIRYIVGYGR